MFYAQIKIITIIRLILQKYIVLKADNDNAVTTKTLSNPVTTRIHDQWQNLILQDCVFF